MNKRDVEGFTLIELIISLAVGAAVTILGVTLYVQTSKNRNLLQAELNLQNKSYFIHQTLRQFFNQAGYRPLIHSNASSSILPIQPTDKAFEAIDGKWAAGEFMQVLDNGFAFRFEGSSDATDTPDGSLFNCQGAAIATGEIANVQFSITDGALSCSSGGMAVEMIGEGDDINVERFAINWGVDTNNDSHVDEFRPSSIPLTTGESLTAVRLSLLLSSQDGIRNTPASYTFDGTEHESTDTRLRRESVTTVHLKN